ncbi:MAG: hypothetical protein L3K05_00210 [Thermoplasmata archaeon]|nr:hypothetical protein [Thermoplasmata archaeon]
MLTAVADQQAVPRRPWHEPTSPDRSPGGRPAPSVLREVVEPPEAEASQEASRTWDQENRLVLSELDFLSEALGRAWRTSPSPLEEIAALTEVEPEARIEVGPPLDLDEPVESLDGSPSPYLEERLHTAQEVAVELSGEFERMERRSTQLRRAVRVLETELRRATEEVAFLRSEDARPVEPDPAPARPMVEPTPAPTGRARPYEGPERPARAASPPYDRFTVDRYNGTIAALVARRRKLAVTSVALSIGISAALLTLTVLAREPIPTPWVLAGLPAVWLIPVPFFLASFRGTHRVLSREPLSLPEAP